MTQKVIRIGIVSSLSIVVIQLTAGLSGLLMFENKYMGLAFSLLNILLNIVMLIVLWKVLVRFYSQSQFDWVLKSMIATLFFITFLQLLIEFQTNKTTLILLGAFLLINLILYFVFLNKIMGIQEHEIEQIKHLRSYALAFILYFLGQFILSVLAELKHINLGYINHFLLAIPIVFVVIFFTKIRDEIEQT